jgi:hypothetical protein
MKPLALLFLIGIVISVTFVDSFAQVSEGTLVTLERVDYAKGFRHWNVLLERVPFVKHPLRHEAMKIRQECLILTVIQDGERLFVTERMPSDELKSFFKDTPLGSRILLKVKEGPRGGWFGDVVVYAQDISNGRIYRH